jgi:hypothetical protein
MDGNYGKYNNSRRNGLYCQFIFSCGYYNYTKGYTPNLRISLVSKRNNPSSKWPENLNVADKKSLWLAAAPLLSLLYLRDLPLKPHRSLCCNDRQPTLPLCPIKKDKNAARLKRIFLKKVAYRLIRYKTFSIRLSFIISASSILKKWKLHPKGAKGSGWLSCRSSFYPKLQSMEQRFASRQTEIFF